MNVVKITAIIRSSTLEAVETRLKQLNVPGITVSTVKGFGEYANFFTHDWMVAHARIEMFVPAEQSDAIVDAIREAAGTGGAGDGLVAVLPVKRLIKIRTGDEMGGSGVSAPTSERPISTKNAPTGQPSGASVFAWLIVVLGIIAAAAVVLITSRHQMHLLAACLGVVLVLCGVLGGLTVANRNRSGRNSGGQ